MSCGAECGVALESLQGNQASSLIEGGMSWCFSSCGRKLGSLSKFDGHLWEPLVLPQGSNAFFQVARGTLGFLLNHCMGIGLHHELGQETQVSTLVVTEISGFLSSFKRGVRPHLMLRHGTPLSSRVVKGVSGLLSSSGRELGLFLEVQQGSQTSLSTVRGYSGFHSSWCRDSGLISS